MSQDSVLKLLKLAERPLTSTEINKKLKMGNASSNLRRLMKQGLVKVVYLTRYNRGYYFV